MKHHLVRGGALVATTALAASLAYAPAASAAAVSAPVGTDPSPAAVGARYLAAQPGANGIIVSHSEFGGTQYDTPSPGITIDAATSLDAVGGQAAEVAKMAAGVESSTYPNGSAGSAAKFAAFEYTLGRTSTALAPAVTSVDQAINTTSRPGRLEDASNDFESPLTQAYAAKALNDAHASNAARALTFLLAQQCTAGYFRDSFSDKSAMNQACDDNDPVGSSPSIDYTAFTVLNLQDQKSAAQVAASLSKATAWLVSQQAANGSFNDGNANSTGLAGWALGVSGQTAAAAKAAGWLRGHQLANAGACTAFAAADNGAIVVDDLGLANAKAGPLNQNDNSTATYATAQALPGLLYAAGGTNSGETTVTPVKDYSFVKAGSQQAVNLAGAPGDTLCVTLGSTATRVVLPPSGSVPFVVAIPKAGGTTTVSTLDAGGEADSYVYQTLGEKKLRLKTAKKVTRGATAKVTVKGLAPKEKVRILIGKKVVRRGHANAQGVFSRNVAVNHKIGKTTLKVLGQFGGLRHGTQKIRVVR